MTAKSNSTRSPITSHVLDISRGKPAPGLEIMLERKEPDLPAWRELGRAITDADGRANDLLPAGAPILPGFYRIWFDTGSYFGAQDIVTFYPRVMVEFEVKNVNEHYHVPLLVSPFGYSTYRGT